MTLLAREANARGFFGGELSWMESGGGGLDLSRHETKTEVSRRMGRW